MVGTAPSSGDCVAYWEMDNTNDSANSHTLTVNGATSGATGIIGNCYSYDGTNDYLEFDEAADLVFDHNSSFSFSTWFKTSSTSGFKTLLQTRPTGGNPQTAFWVNGSGYVEIYVIDSTGATRHVVDTGNIITDGSWHHAVFVQHKTDGLKLYVDNSLIGTDTTSQSGDISYNNPSNTYDFWRIGASYTGSNSFNGNIDESSIFDTALSADNITYLYQGGSPGSDQQYPFGTVGYNIAKINGVSTSLISKYNGVSLSSINKINGVTLGSASGPFNGHASLATDIVSYYKCDTNGSFIDAHASNNGTIDGATYTASGKINGGYDFDGTNDDVTSSSAWDISTKTGVSISGWFYPTGNGDYAGVSTGTQNSGGLHLRLTTGNVWQIMMDDPDETRYRYRNGNAAISLNAWYYVVATYESTEVKLWVNGVAQTTGASGASGTNPSFSAMTGSAADNFYFGASSVNTGNDAIDRFYEGTLDEVGIWSKLLSDTEASDLYNSGTGLQY